MVEELLAPGALRDRAAASFAQGDTLAAGALWLQSLRLDSAAAPAWRGRAHCLLAEGRQHEALLCLEQALRVAAPGGNECVEILDMLSQFYLSVERLRDCDGVLRRLAELDATSPAIEFRRAKVALGLRRFQQARQAFAAARSGGAEGAALRFEHSMLALRGIDGAPDWASAWDDYEARFVVYGHDGLTCYPHAYPLWEGESLAARNLLVHREQGYGDMIMFASTLPQLKERVSQLVVSVPPALARLFAHSFPGVHVSSSRVVQGEALRVAQDWLRDVPPVHVQLPFCSLGARLRRSASAFGAPRAYLSADAASSARFAKYLADMDPAPSAGLTGLTVGLAWGARAIEPDGSRNLNGWRKSIPPEQLAVLSEAANVRWVSLMNREAASGAAAVEQLHPLDFSWALRDFMDTAALIEQVDVVVAVDTAVAHLAAALGKETWVLLRWHPDWRWDHEGLANPWYPHVRLACQAHDGDWSGPLRQVVEWLRQRQEVLQ